MLRCEYMYLDNLSTKPLTPLPTATPCTPSLLVPTDSMPLSCFSKIGILQLEMTDANQPKAVLNLKMLELNTEVSHSHAPGLT